MTDRRLLVITRNLPPLTGGMEKLMSNAIQQLGTDYELTVIGPRGCSRFLDKQVRCYSTPRTGLLGYLLSALPLVILSVLRCRPAAVIAGSGVTAPLAWLASAIARRPTLVLVHGLDLIVNNRAYRAIALPAIRSAACVVANSRNTATLARESGVAAERLLTIEPGVEYPPHHAAKGTFRQEFALDGRPVLLSVGRLVPRKGLAPFVEHALTKVLKKHPEAVLAIVGEVPQDALMHDKNERNAVEDIAARAGLVSHIIFCGHLSESMLAAAYADADLLVFPVIDVPGDVEGFGMVALEAAAFGVPTFGFEVGGLTDSVLPSHTGELVRSGAYHRLAETICRYLERKDRSSYRENCLRHAENHSWSRYGERLRPVLRLTILKEPPTVAEKI